MLGGVIEIRCKYSSIGAFIHRGPIFGVGVLGLYSEFHGIISNDWGSHFFLGYCDW